MTDAVLIDLATKVDPAHRGRLHRHRLPLPRDARDGRGGAPPLRPQPADDDRRPPRRGAVAGRPGELLLGGEGRPARPGPRRQGGLDERPAPRPRPPPAARRRSSPATSGAWSRSTRSPPGPTLDVEGYIADHDVPVNPLRDQGYPSIGCMPCTQLADRPRGPPLRPLGRPGQDGVRPPRAARRPAGGGRRSTSNHSA